MSSVLVSRLVISVLFYFIYQRRRMNDVSLGVIGWGGPLFICQIRTSKGCAL